MGGGDIKPQEPVLLTEQRELGLYPDERMTYKEYLRTDVWAGIRGKALEHYGNSCVMCGKSKGLQVHHRRYSYAFGMEEVRDLVVLCSGCHAKFHGKLDKQRGDVETRPKEKRPKQKDKRNALRAKRKQLEKQTRQRVADMQEFQRNHPNYSWTRIKKIFGVKG